MFLYVVPCSQSRFIYTPTHISVVSWGKNTYLARRTSNRQNDSSTQKIYIKLQK